MVRLLISGIAGFALAFLLASVSVFRAIPASTVQQLTGESVLQRDDTEVDSLDDGERPARQRQESPFRTASFSSSLATAEPTLEKAIATLGQEKHSVKDRQDPVLFLVRRGENANLELNFDADAKSGLKAVARPSGAAVSVVFSPDGKTANVPLQEGHTEISFEGRAFKVSLGYLTGTDKPAVVNAAWMLQTKTLNGDTAADVSKQTISSASPLASSIKGMNDRLGEIVFAQKNGSSEYQINGSAQIQGTGRYAMTMSVEPSRVLSSVPALGEVVLNLGTLEILTKTPANEFTPRLVSVYQEIETAALGGTPRKTEWLYNPSTISQTPILLAKSNLKISVEPARQGRTFKARIDQKPEPSSNASTFDLNFPLGEHVIDVVDTWTLGDAASSPILVKVPSNQLDRPQILYYRQGGGETPVNDATNGISVVGQEVTLIGRTTPGTQLQVLLLEPQIAAGGSSDSPGQFEQRISAITVPVQATGMWEQTLTLPVTSRETRVIAVSTGASTHQYSLAVPVVRNVDDATVVTLGGVTLGYTDSFGVPRTAVGKQIGATAATLRFTNCAGLKGGDIVRARRGGEELAVSSVTIAPAEKSLDMTVSGLKRGMNRLLISVGRGSSRSPEKEVEIFAVTQGPYVESWEPRNFGVAPGVTSLKLKFNVDSPLAKEFAEQKSNYALIGSRGSGKVIQPEEARLLASNEVVLVFRKNDGTTPISPDEYELRINANSTNTSAVFGTIDKATRGIRDQLGLRLDSNGLAQGGEGEDVSIQLADASGSGASGGSGASVDARLPLRQQLALPSITAEQPDVLTQRVGLPETTGRPVDYPEFTQPRPSTEGFNPSDKVVTRVARLYFFRDGHRVAQIINRRAKSYNAQNATMARQLADKARLFAEQTTDRRRAAERQAVDSAAYSREAENRLARYQSELAEANATAFQGRADVKSLQEQIKTLESEAANPAAISPGKYAGDTRTAAERLDAARQQVAAQQQLVSQSEQKVGMLTDYSKATLSALEALRERELQQRETMNREQAADDRAADHQFRLELQAATTDPDTYVEGNPAGFDPVAQVTISVIGEGLLQLRGPSKGVNIVQTMINELDAPTGQVRVGIHTVQINGENGEDMEQVASRIQRYTDHSRFLTAQSGQMLRNAVAFVASRKAQQFGYASPAYQSGEAAHEVPPVPGSCPPNDLNLFRYQDAFFGGEFMQQLRRMDSELTRPANQLLSLNSMDTTSLASSLFLTALASNETRKEILQVFQQQTMVKLPADEFEYFNASDCQKWYHFRKFSLLADNARFVSLRGYLDGEIAGDQTLNPVQREFIKLAQILKSRLVNEVELKQRVIERALIEERVGSDYEKQQKAALQVEQEASAQLDRHQKALRRNIEEVLKVAVSLQVKRDADENNLKGLTESIFESVRPKFSLASGLLPGEEDRNDFNTEEVGGIRGVLGLPSEVDFEEESESDAAELIEESTRKFESALRSGNAEVACSLAFTEAERLQNIAIKGVKNDEDVKNGLISDLSDGTSCIVTLEFSNGLDISTEIRRKRENGQYKYKDDIFDEENLVKYIEWLQSQAEMLRRIELAAFTPREAFEFDRLIADLEKGGSVLKPAFFLANVVKIRKAKESEKIQAVYTQQNRDIQEIATLLRKAATAAINGDVKSASTNIESAHARWAMAKSDFSSVHASAMIADEQRVIGEPEKLMDRAINELLTGDIQYQFAVASAEAARRPLDHKKFLDMLIDEAEEKQIQLLEGTRAHTAVIDDYVKRICTALEDDFNTQFYEPAFRRIREETYHCGTVSLGQIEHTSVLTGNRQFAKVQPQATMEFDLPKRRIMIAEAMAAAQAGMSDYGALLGDPNFLALTKLYSGQPTSSTFSGGAAGSQVRDVLPGLPSQTGESAVIQAQSGQPQFQSQLESLVPDPAIYKFETGTGYEIRPVIQPDGQSVLFDLNYMYTTNVREPVAADEKHLGRVKRHFIDTDVQVGNYELREVSRYRVALKAERSGRGVPLLESIPGAGALFRPVNDGESSLQQNIILAHSVIYPTLFDLMGLRWAPAVADLDEEDIKLQEFTYRNRMRSLKNEVYDYSSSQVDEFLRIPQSERRPDLYRTQVPIPGMHPNGYSGPGNGQFDSHLLEGDGLPLREGEGLEEVPAEENTSEVFPPQGNVVPPAAVGSTRSETVSAGGNAGRVRLADSAEVQQGARDNVRVRTVSGSDRPARKDSITSRLRGLATGKSSHVP